MDDRSLKGWAKVILKDRYGKEVKQDMARLKRTKLRKNPLPATWQELGMKPGIRVPGTASWMAEWRRSPNQKKMIDFASDVHLLVGRMTEKEVGEYLKMYLTGKWAPSDEKRIAAAIRRSPTWEAKYNVMEEELMGKKKTDTAKKVQEKAEGTSLKARIEALEEEVEALKEAMTKMMPKTLAEAKAGKKEKKALPGTSVSGDVKALLKELAEAKEKGDKSAGLRIRKELRKAGYSLRANGKK